jgi:predicted O-methyltransferase YrrM
MAEEYQSLQQQLALDQGIPYSPNWSAAADFLQIIVDACLTTKPESVFECSSGLTTLMLARCCQINGYGRVISLEDGKSYAATTREYLARYGLEGIATVIDAPLRAAKFDGHEYSWYSWDRVPDSRIDMLVIDGPCGFIGKHARYPALPACYPYFAHQTKIYLDDAARPDEREIVALWCERYPGVTHDYIQTARGCSVLTIEQLPSDQLKYPD